MERLVKLIKSSDCELMRKLYEKQQKKLQALTAKPLRIEPDVILVSSAEGILNIPQLVAQLEVRILQVQYPIKLSTEHISALFALRTTLILCL